MGQQVRLTRTIIVPDSLKVARFAKAPELGPRILFFSGGSALRPLSRRLTSYTHNSSHIITAFDSGGSSAVLRRAFRMLAIGDLRARIMDLADQSIKGNPEIYALFAHRLKDEPTREFAALVRGGHPLLAAVPDPMRKIIREYLVAFNRQMPADFALNNASVGNLILTAGYLQSRRHPDPVIYLFSKLVEARGTVRPVLNSHLHLAAVLEGRPTPLVGQHLLTGKETPPITAKIEELFLTASQEQPIPVRPPVRRKIRELIAAAELICFPMGSFYSSVLANLLPAGVGIAIGRNPCPKVFIPNTSPDPEGIGMSLMDQVRALHRYCRQDDPALPPERIINFLVVDTKNADYPGGLDLKELKKSGVEVLDLPLISHHSRPLIDEDLLLPVLLSLS